MRGLRQAAAACVAVLALAGSTGISLAQDLTQNTTLEIFPAPLSANLLAKRQAYFEATQPQLTESLLAAYVDRQQKLKQFDVAAVVEPSSANITPLPRSNVFVVYNSVHNTPVKPFCGLPPRPNFIAERQDFTPVGAR